MKILFVASLHHPEALQAAIASTPHGQALPLFPPSMAQHFWEKALRKRGHTLDVFYRNLSALSRNSKSQRHRIGFTPGKLLTALGQRIPPRLNLDCRLRNRRLLDQAIALQPDVLWMTGDNTVIYPETLAAIQHETGCKLVYACGTSPIVFSHPIDRAAARLYDLVLASDYYHGIQWLEMGAKRMECLPLAACDPDFHRPFPLPDTERAQYTCDVAFVGTLVPDNLYSRRVRALEALCDFDLGIWSVHDAPPGLRPYLRGSALGAEMLQVISAARICFNTHGDFVHYGGNQRLFEVAGAGVFQITDDLPGVRQWFTVGATIETYRTLGELREKIAYYLEHEDQRQAIARQARAHVYEHHTYDQRAAQLETLLADL